MMLEKRTRLIQKLLEPETSDNRTGFSGENPALSWTSPLDLKMRSPRRWKNQESEGIGLGIVAALEKSSTSKIKMVGISNASVTNPIPIATPRTSAKNCCSEEFGLDSFESYTCVISHGPNSNFTSDDYHVGDKNRGDSDTRWGNWGHEIQAYPMADFLKCCSLCLKKLHGKDIFMYRGEKAFCSPECRYQQIMADEHKEMYGSEVSKTSKISASPYSGDRLFFTGILVA